jgi:hypothetical protein
MKNVVINDWWDRSPCIWICDLDKLDETDPIQAKYKQLIELALEACEITSPDHEGVPDWYLSGASSIEDVEGADWGGRPDEVDHAKVHPPCEIVGIVTLWYGF